MNWKKDVNNKINYYEGNFKYIYIRKCLQVNQLLRIWKAWKNWFGVVEKVKRNCNWKRFSCETVLEC